MKPSVLLIDDEPSVLFGYRKYLEKSGYETTDAATLADAREAFDKSRFDAVLLDMFLPDGNGLNFVPEIRTRFPGIAIVVITGAGAVPEAVDALKKGADNFLAKPVNMDDLEVFLRKSIEVGGLRRGDIRRKRLEKKTSYFFGESRLSKEAYDYAQLASENDSTVLIHGETGVGKGVMARWIHEHCKRSSDSFVEVNCSSLRGDLLSSELFGHAKGAFTSAISDREGLVEVADRGTLFLDEIGDMDMAVQAQFLKVIEEKSYRRVGEVMLRHSDFRLICATNRDLKRDVSEGRFRKDLYFRINVLPLKIAPLRERREDIQGLVKFFLDDLGFKDRELSSDILKVLMEYPWPGNIREMKNVLERAIMLSRGKDIALEYLSGISSDDHMPTMDSPGGMKSLQQVEEEHISHIIDQCDGDVQRASELLGISRATLYRKMKNLKDD